MIKNLALTVLLALAINSHLIFAQENIHKNTVSNRNSYDIKNFKIVPNANQIAVLQTRPAGNEKFIPKTGKVVASKRHGGIFWSTTENSDILHEAKSAPIPMNTASWVICTGQFDLLANIVNKGGNKNGTKGKESVPQKGPSWRSELTEPDVHVIIFNQYNRGFDTKPIRIRKDKVLELRWIDKNGNPQSIKPIRNMGFCLAAERIQKKYIDYGSKANQVIMGSSGLKCNTHKQLPTIDKLTAFLTAEKVNNKSVSTYHSLGHGDFGEMLYAKPIQELHVVKKENVLGAGPNVIDAQTKYAAWLSPFLKLDAIVTLHHCFSAGVSPDFGVNKSVAELIDAGLPQSVVVTGHKVGCYYDFDTSTGVLRGRMPTPDREELGDTWGIVK